MLYATPLGAATIGNPVLHYLLLAHAVQLRDDAVYRTRDGAAAPWRPGLHGGVLRGRVLILGTFSTRFTELEMMAKGTFASVVLASNDLDALFERVQASGAELMQEPTDQDYGVRDCAFREPSGNTVRIQEAV